MVVAHSRIASIIKIALGQYEVLCALCYSLSLLVMARASKKSVLQLEGLGTFRRGFSRTRSDWRLRVQGAHIYSHASRRFPPVILGKKHGVS